MNRVNAEVRISETTILKRENRLLWAMVAALFIYSLYMCDKVERIKAQVNPQAVYEACTRSMK